MRKKLLLSFCAMLLCIGSILAQNIITVSGVITDEKGKPIEGASVIDKKTGKGASTDANGVYKLAVSKGATLQIKSINSQTVEVIANSETISLSLKALSEDLSEVVVTALGIKREKKALGYSAQEITGGQLNQANTSNTLSAMSGKIAGLQVTNSSGTPGAAAYIRLRGVTSLGGGEPLIVVDGVPIDNSTTGISLGNVAQSNRAVDINPDDIESITVLKGPAAASLYGTQGSDGVIVITTKRGKKSKDGSKFDISYSYGLTFDQVNKLPELQNMYVQGTNGALRTPLNHTSTSFGPRADTLKWTGVANQWDVHGNIVGASNPAGTIPFVPYDNAKQFFRTGLTQNHNFSLSGGNDITTYRFSFSNLTQDGIIPLSGFQRNTVTLSADTKVSDNIKTGGSITYVNSGGSRIQEGSNLSGVMLGLLRTPNSFDNSYGSSDPSNLSAYQFADGTQRSYRGIGVAGAAYAWYDNPYWTINKNKFKDDVNRIIGNAYITYTPYKWLSITDRIGIDEYSDNRKQDFALNTASSPYGQVIYDLYTYRHINNDLLVTLSHKINNQLNGSLLLGSTYYSQTNQHNNSTGTGLTIPDFYDLGNTSSQTAFTSSSTVRRKAFFAQAKFEYNNYLFLDVTAREENSSAFVSNQDTKGVWYLFPSANASFLFSDALNIKNKMFNYGKLRVSYGQAGRLPSIYRTNTYFASGGIGDGWTNGLVYPINGQQGFFAGTLGNPNLKPERTTTLDIGADLRFWNNRINLSVTYYNSTSKDLLASVPIAPSSGYGNIYTNAAEITNHGVEVQLGITPVRTKSFTWDVTVNWSMNRSNVVSLGPGIDQLFLGGFTNGSINAVKNQPFGVIYGIGYVKDNQGNTVISDGIGSTAGFPIVNSNSVALGNPNPKWIGGIQNSFTYNKFNFSFLFDTKQKFDMWDGTRGALVNFGRAKETDQRGQNTTFKGVSGHLDASGNVVVTGSANKTSVVLGQSWYQGGGSGFTVNEPFIEDASFVKLREVTFGYTFDFANNKSLKKIFKSINVNFIGRNLLLITNYKGIDPETSLAGGTALGIDYFNNPSTASYGFNIKLNL